MEGRFLSLCMLVRFVCVIERGTFLAHYNYITFYSATRYKAEKK